MYGRFSSGKKYQRE